MNRIIKLIIAAGCIFSLIAFPVACGGDDAAEHKVPEKKAESAMTPPFLFPCL